jgi:predicted transcriptional regulator
MEITMQIDRHDPFYFSRSDLSDEEKLTILDSELKESLEDIKAGRVYTVEQVRAELKAKFSSMMKKAS